jgi:hypothetical protein
MKMMLSELIEKLDKKSDHPNVKRTVTGLRQLLATDGDVQIDVDHMCRVLGVTIN